MVFFDCNCRFGFETVPPAEFCRTEAELVKEMDFNGIDKAMAVYSEGFYDRPSPRTVSQERLYPVLNYFPCRNVEELQDQNLRHTITAGNFKALWFSCHPGRYGLSAELFEACFHIIEDMHLPLLLDLNRPGTDYLLDYEPMNRFLSMYPGLPVILMNTSYRIDISLYPLMERHSNLHIETSGYQGFRAIEALAARFGSRRILFGSRYPFLYPAASRFRVESADLSDKDKENIAHKNMENLLEAIIYE